MIWQRYSNSDELRPGEPITPKSESEDYPIAIYYVKIIKPRFPGVLILSDAHLFDPQDRVVVLRSIALLILGIWLLLVLLGKGGFVHLLLLNGLGVAAVDMMVVYRAGLARVD